MPVAWRADAGLTRALLILALSGAGAAAQGTEPALAVAQGPWLGHTTSSSARVWARFSSPGTAALVVAIPDGDPAEGPVRVVGHADPDADLCVVFTADGLRAGTTYSYRVESAAGAPLTPPVAFRTAPAAGAPARVRLAFGSCAYEDDATASAWTAILGHAPDAVVLLGDTPYIDSPILAVQRRRYREFFARPALVALCRSTPLYATWDDHDFGANDTDGRLPGKADSRRAFVEYHANPGYGADGVGIYTSFRRGPLEVFLLDTRWFAATEPSPAKAHAASLLGARQWKWLQDGLLASTAPFKVLACGMVWNDAVRPGKLDHWGSYAHERDALFAWLGEHSIRGVVLVGGDIHRSRVIRHATTDLAGYDLLELITSPLHGGLIAAAAAPHPGLVADLPAPHSFLLLDADSIAEPPTLRARIVDADGREWWAGAVR